MNSSKSILLTGGFGEHFNSTSQPHAAYLKARLASLGVPEDIFLRFAESLNTLQDASLSRPIACATGLKRIIVVTSDYHVDRARYVFEKEYTGSEVELEFVETKTDENKGELDYVSLKAHEKSSLARMRALNVEEK